MSRWRKLKGQGLVEFALILPALLMIILSIIEGALLFQAYLAVQHAAREAARFAVTYQPPITYSEEQGEILLKGGNPGPPAYPDETTDEWNARRVHLIKQHALDAALGLNITQTGLDRTSFEAFKYDPGFFGVRIWGFPQFPSGNSVTEQEDHPSLPGLPVRIIVYYRWEPLDPLIGAIVPNGVMLTGESVMINEGIQVGVGSVLPPTFAPPPSIEPPTATPPGGTSVATDTPTPTTTPAATNTPTPTPVPPTATPTRPYIILYPPKDRWLEDELPGQEFLIFNHLPDPGPYQVYWTDNCGNKQSLGIALRTSGGNASSHLPTGFNFLSDACGPIAGGQTYNCVLSTDLASVIVPVYVPPKRPDLVVKEIRVPPEADQGGTFVLGILIENQGQGTVTNTFDVDIYIDPGYTPMKGMPGLGTAGGDSPKQWWTAPITPGGTQLLNYVVHIPPKGDHTIWAQVDTSDFVDEEDDENNISGPVALHYPCSDQCDDFSDSLAKWQSLVTIGTDCSGSGGAQVDNETLMIYGTGCSIFNSHEGRFYFLHQGEYNGDFDMRVRVLERPNRTWAKAGLMVRESPNTLSRFVAIAVSFDGSTPVYQSVDRLVSGTGNPVSRCEIPIPASRFDGDPSNGEGVWLRIVREGNTFTKYTSLDGNSWSTDTCMTVTFDQGFADPSYPGIFMAPY